MITIELHKVMMKGFHGVHEEERKKMNIFEVNLDVKFSPPKPRLEKLEDTISYADLYRLVQDCMENPGELLETICLAAINRIKSKYPYVREITMSVHKLHAPIEQFDGMAGVKVQERFED